MASESIEVMVNGQRRAVPDGQSVAALLGLLKVGADKVAVELNRSIVRKRDWETTPVPAGANIEIVEFVGGG
jgi:sulfur carrier protein